MRGDSLAESVLDEGAALTTPGLCSHWTDMPEWYPGRRLWAFYLTFENQPALHARVQHDQHALQGIPGLDLIQLSRIHLSLQGIAFVDEIDPEKMAQLAAVVQHGISTQELPALFASPAAPDFDAICLPVFPVEELGTLKKLIRDAAAEILGEEKLYKLPESPGGFMPHISIAYANASVSADDLALGLRRMDTGVTPMDVRELSLVALRREARSWFWDYERRIPFNARALDMSGARERTD
jgi:2'-5' RNA ligase